MAVKQTFLPTIEYTYFILYALKFNNE